MPDVQVIREHLTRDQRPFLHPESLQIFRFTASSLQFTHSSSTGFRSENTWHEIRDHSFIQNHSRSSDSQLLLFSSLTIFYRVQIREHLTRDQRSFLHPNHSRSSDSQLLLFSHSLIFLQGSDQRTPDTRSETIPSSRITPDLQIHSFFSSVHSLILLQGSGQRTPDTRSEIIPSSRITPDLQIHSFFLQFTHSSSKGSGQRTPDTRSEIIPSSRITPDLQIHSFFSSVHSLMFYRVQVREHLTRDQRPFLHPESLQIFRFTASPLQFTHVLQGSGRRNPDTRSEIIPFIQNHSRSSDSQLLFFSSLTHLLQGQVREHLTRDQRSFPSSRITPDLQIHSFFSSVHSLIFYRVQVREHLTRDQRSFLHPESLQIFRFTASSLQFTHSSSTGFRSENTWHEIRDHSFIQNHSRSSDSQLSSSVHSLIFYRVQIREHLTEIRDHSFIQNHSDLQIHSFFSSVHSLIFYRVRSENPEHEIRDHLHPDHSRIFRFTASFLQFTHSSSTGFRSRNTWHEIIGIIPYPNHSKIFDITASSLQVHSLMFYRVQVREHLTRDQRSFLHSESLQIFRFTASPLQFTHVLQGSGRRTPDTRSEIIPSSRITPDLQIHSFFSSVHHSSSTGFRSENTWHEIRDHSFIQNHSRSSDSQLLLFSSLTHLLQVQIREHWHEIRDHSFIQNHSRSSDTQLLLFSSPSLIFYRVQIREHLTRDQRSFLQPESLQIFRFTASFLQFTHSSSTGFRSENTWHEIRDHSFIQNHSRSSDSQLLFFSSLTHLLQGSDQRTPDTRSEIIPSSRITPDLQIHSFFSSVHLTHLLQGSDQRTPDTRSEIIPSSRITPDLQIHSFSSSVHSLIFYRVQIREHLTRDQRSFLHPESLQILQIHSFFSSVHLTHLLQGSDQRTPDTRSETIPSSESLQIFRYTASSLQFTHSSSTGFRSEDWNGRSRSLVFVFLRFVFGLMYGWKIQTWPIIRFLTDAVTFFICWYLVESRMPCI